MDIRILAARRATASERLHAAAETLADRFGLTDQVHALRAARSKDRDVDALLRAEATADLLDALVTVTNPTESLPDESERLGVLNVTEATALIEGATAEEVDALEAAEAAGKQRKGVYEAIHARRAALEAEAEAAATDDGADSGGQAPDGSIAPAVTDGA